MNQKLVESLAQIILALSNEERQLLEREIQTASVSKQVEDLKSRLKKFEETYQMPSEHFHQRFIHLNAKALFWLSTHLHLLRHHFGFSIDVALNRIFRDL
jgi:hypothetical protein